MKISEIVLHNFRSIKEQKFILNDYSLLIGANNSGKTNIVDALRMFYEKDIKFKNDRDFPKFKTDDEESWIEIEFNLTDDEFESLKEEYKRPENKLRVRRYFKHPEKAKANQSNIYGYEDNKLSDNLFYGWKTVGEGKLGDVIYVPEVTKVDDYTKLSGPSAFRGLLEFVVKKVVKGSPSFESLTDAFLKFNEKFKEEASKDGFSLNNLIEDVNKEIKDWGISFGVNINQIRPEEIIKNLVSHYFEDKHLKGQILDTGYFGQGLQRHFIYTLIKLSAKYKEPPTKKERKEFSPDFTLILFEEPEAFLHPAQQEVLNLSFREIAGSESQQVFISTHSTHFASKNIEEIPSTIKLFKDGAETSVFQISNDSLQEIFKENKELKEILGEALEKKDLDLESIRYSLYFDPDRCCAFFSDKVLICEGLSEKALIDCLIKEKKLTFQDSKVYILNAAGKYDIHRYMNLFGKLGIRHSVLFDGDNDKDKHKKVNEFIEKNKNDCTINLHQFEGNFEGFLEIEQENDRYKKPLNVMWHYRNNKITDKKINELIDIIKKLVEQEP
ncbi:TPA: ATP-dependent endonuclease [Candidatus Bathyarchaeota archaeon]|nr:ATP-dependent endonuclease [Candidatus Bathyarchaeota archaeon]